MIQAKVFMQTIKDTRERYARGVKVITKIRQKNNLIDIDELSANSFINTDFFPCPGGSFSEGTGNENSEAGMMIRSIAFQNASSSFDEEGNLY